ncbi:DUF3626 domain-containing protein [Prauserella alba]|uniref:DUF3626 domain-containing protein n=1 Tax=Prauserella alba TaxID=176898 RepID=UPI0020A392A6|nr:DUF3626 domain-containing protein [Prauserella alba]
MDTVRIARRPAARGEAAGLRFHPDWPHGEQKIIESLAADREPADVGDATLLPSLCHMADESGLDDLDAAVEAHVHGAVRLDLHVDAIVLDPCFARTDVEEAATRTDCRVEFHPGFLAAPDDIDESYREAHIVALAQELGPVLTPNVIGDAARRGEHPRQWIKQVWHCLARFGRRAVGAPPQNTT